MNKKTNYKTSNNYLMALVIKLFQTSIHKLEIL